MMRARWIRLAGACRALASLRRVRSSAGSVGGRADSGGLAMWSPSSARRRHNEHEADRQTIPRLRNAALGGQVTRDVSVTVVVRSAPWCPSDVARGVRTGLGPWRDARAYAAAIDILTVQTRGCIGSEDSLAERRRHGEALW